MREASHASAGARFRSALDVRQGVGRRLRSERVPRGAVAQRTVRRDAGSTRACRRSPDGEYAFVLFRTAFANKTDARETVTLEREADGKWRVIGYVDSTLSESALA